MSGIVVGVDGSEVSKRALEDAERRGADVDVVHVYDTAGTRGHGGFAGLLLGSVSHQCVSHPPCPVTVVPHA